MTTVLIPGSRACRFSKVDAGDTPQLYPAEKSVDPAVVLPPPTSLLLRGSNLIFLNWNAADPDVKADPRASTRMQPVKEISGDSRNSYIMCEDERYYDSWLPSLDKCFSKDGATIYTCPADHPWLTSYGWTKKSGFIWFDFPSPSWEASFPDFKKFVNNNWTKAFPFEPRYASINRVDKITRTFTARNVVSSSNFPATLTVTPISPTTMNDLSFVTYGSYGGDLIPNGVNGYTSNTLRSHVTADIDLSQKSIFGGGPYYFGKSGPISSTETIKYAFGFGDQNTMIKSPLAGSVPSEANTYYGTNHAPSFRSVAVDTLTKCQLVYCTVIRGWKYGLVSGLPTYTKTVWRRDRYGQLRDMLEQRPYTKFTYPFDYTDIKSGLPEGPVSVRFVNSSGSTVSPSATASQNLSFEVTSSLPYFDGVARNRT